MMRLVLLLSVALFAVQLAEAAEAPAVNMCIKIHSGLLTGINTDRFAKCSLIQNEQGKTVGVVGGSGSSADCLHSCGGTVDGSCIPAATIAAVCCACYKIERDGISLPPACQCHSDCVYGGKGGWTGTSCSGCGDPNHATAASGYGQDSSGSYSDKLFTSGLPYSGGFASTSSLHVDMSQCGTGGFPVASQESKLLQAKTEASCNDPAQIADWTCDCAEQLEALYGTSDPSDASVQAAICADTQHNVCQTWKTANCNEELLQKKSAEQKADDLLSLLAETSNQKAKVGWNCG